MPEKLNIYLDLANLTVDGDEFRYKYSYEDIIFMIDGMTKEINKETQNETMIQAQLVSVQEKITGITENLAMLNQIKQAIEAQQ